MSTLKVNTLTNVAGNADIGNVGKILQVVQTFKGDTTTTTGTSFVDITGMTASITPTSTSNKVLVRFTLHLSTTSATVTLINLLRGSTNIAQPTTTATYNSSLQVWTNADRMVTQTYEFLDSPATTSATTYKLQWGQNVSATLKLNGYYGNTDYHSTSTMTLQEVSA